MGHAIRFLVLLSLLSYSSVAQDPIALRKRFHDERQIYLKKSEELVFKYSDNSLEITEHIHEERILLNEKMLDDSEDEIAYAPPFSSFVSAEASSRIYNSGRYRSGSGAVSEEKHREQKDVFYDDVRIRKVAYPGLSPGSIVQLDYILRVHDPLFLRSIYFSNGPPVLEAEFKVIMPEGVRIGWKLKGDSSLVRFRIEKKRGQQILIWNASELPRYRFYNDGQSYKHYLPQLYIWLEAYQEKGQEIKFNHSLDAFNKKNYSFIRSAMKHPLPNTAKALVDSVIKSSKSNFERASALFKWVQDHIRYISIEDGYSGQVPRNPEVVCSNGYGDCKDMAVLLSRLLHEAGLPAYPAWIGTREIPVHFRSLQHLASSNHMIATLKTDTGLLFLDATGREHGLGRPSEFIQGREACVAIDSNTFESIMVPWVSADSNKWVDTLWCRIKGDTLVGKGHVILSGFYRDNITQAFRSRTKDKYEELMKGIFSRGNDKCKIINPQVNNLFSSGNSLNFNFEIEIDHLVRKIDSNIYINLNLEKAWQRLLADTSGGRQNGKEFDFLHQRQILVYLDLPSGYLPRKLPDTKIENNAYCSWKISYFMKGSQLILNSFFEIKKAEIPFEELSVWNNIVNRFKELENQSLILTKQ